MFSQRLPLHFSPYATVAIQKLADNPKLSQTVRENALQLWSGLEDCRYLDIPSAPKSRFAHSNLARAGERHMCEE